MVRDALRGYGQAPAAIKGAETIHHLASLKVLNTYTLARLLSLELFKKTQ